MTHNNKPIWPGRWWWAILIIIVIVAGAFRFTGYDFSLPYVDHPDEPQHLIAGRMILEAGTSRGVWHDAYPPGLQTLNYVILRWFNPSGAPHLQFVGPVRLITITVSLVGVVFIALIGYQAAGPLAGLIAAIVWAVTPLNIEFSRYAVPDPYLSTFALLAVWAAITQTESGHMAWRQIALVGLIMSILFKTQGIFLTPLILLLPFWRLRSHPHERSTLLKEMAKSLVWFGVFLFWLIIIYPTLEASDRVPYWSGGSITGLGDVSLAAILKNLATSCLAYSSWMLIAALLGYGGFAVDHQRIRSAGFLGLVTAPLLWVLGISLFSVADFRQFFGVSAMLAALIGIGLTGWIALLSWGYKRLAERISHLPTWGPTAFVSLMVGLFCIPSIQTAVRETREFTLHDQRNDLMVWADSTLSDGRYIGTTEFHKVFFPDWGGYTGAANLGCIETSNLVDHPVDYWRERDINYAILPYSFYAQQMATKKTAAYFDDILLLKSWRDDENFRGPSIAVFSLTHPKYEAHAKVGPINLIGYDLSNTHVAQGQNITFRLYWQADSPTSVPLQVYNHVTTFGSREILAQADGSPLPEGKRTTDRWDDPNEKLIGQEFSILLPQDLPVGSYRLISGLYDPATGIRLLAENGEDYLTIATITVTD